jgi:hypothetical protein
MTVNNPPSYLQNDGPNAEQHRQHMTAAFGEREGVIEGLAVTEKSGTPNMSVDVAEGRVLVAGTEGTYQGLYMCHNRGVENLAISASDPTNDRYDLIVATVEDADYSGATDAWKLDVVSGTPAATPLFPAIDDNTFVLATVLVQNGVSSIVDADITDIRSGTDTDGTTTLTNYGLASTLSGRTRVAGPTLRPQSPYNGMSIFDTSTDREWFYDEGNTLWIPRTSHVKVNRNSTNQSISNSTITTVQWEQEEGDLDGMVTLGTSTTRINCLWPGIYHAAFQVRWASNSTGYREAYIQINGAARWLARQDAVAGSQSYQVVSGPIYVTNTTSYIEFAVLQTSGGALNLEGVGSFDPSATVIFQSFS